MRKITNDELGRPTPKPMRLWKRWPSRSYSTIYGQCRMSVLFRTSDAFGVERIALCGITATPPARDIHKTALGAELTVPWNYYETTEACIAALHEQGYLVYAVEQVLGATMLDDFHPEAGRRYALVFGNEVAGVGQQAVDMCDGAIEIPQMGVKHSLNVSVSGGVVLWNFFAGFVRIVNFAPI